ncbi:polymorphic toxin-type HINT domain-containing protein [Kitasatospora sp. NPDC089509]|uniref:polymorphic toxin-type HINT domain-containing protein n=1 Tax=Kitasatospora sp. NPDC089509 TaxID=3364079 RepID=UPI0037FAC39A
MAKKATQEATAETLAAKNDAQRAAAAADRAAEATQRAADAARASISAAQAAVQAANVASAAAGRAAAAASGAAQATSRAFASAAAGKADEDAATAAVQAAKQAGYAAKAADRASGAAFQAGIAAERAASAVANVNAAADAADEAGGYADQAGASSAKARQAAAQARRNAAEATRSANAAAKLAKDAGQYAAEARDAANSAADHATKAAESARNASANAGNATTADQQAAAHAENARQAATAAGSAVAKARVVQQQAQIVEAENLKARKARGIVQAQDTKAAYDASQREADDAKTRALRLDQEAVQLAARASQPGTDPATVVADGRKMALAALKVRGPWAKSAAEFALAGSDEAVTDYVRTAWQTSSQEDERAETQYLADTSEYDSVRTAAATALTGDATQVHAFLQTGRHTAALSQYRVKVSQLIETGGPHLKEAAKAALETNTPDSLLTFLTRGRYDAKAVDDRLTASRLIETGGDEVKSAAQIALEGPYTLLTDFLTTGQYRAQQQDQLTAAHTASTDNAINGAAQVAALADQNAAQAAQYAAIAAGAATDANNAAAQAKAAANAAAGFAQQAKSAADNAQASATKANGYAATARAAQATAGQAARSAQYSAVAAEASAAAARESAARAYAAVASARQSAENAGKSSAEARAIADAAQKEAVTAAREQFLTGMGLQMTQAVIQAIGDPWEEFLSRTYNQVSTFEHTALDLMSFLPWVGTPAAVVNCAWYAGEYFADYASGEDVLWSCLSIVPGARLLRFGAKYFKWAAKLDAAGGALSSWTRNLLGKAPILRRLVDAPSCLNSFPAGTRVLMGDRTTRPIEQLHTGDTVTATDPATGTTGPRTVDDTIYNPDDTNFTELTVTTPDGTTKSTVTSTDHHPYWVQNTGRWTDAAAVRPGDTLRTDTGATAQVASTRHWTGLEPAYNLTVHDLHTYYVLAGDTPLLVHNVICLDFKKIFDKLPRWVRGPNGKATPTVGQIITITEKGIESVGAQRSSSRDLNVYKDIQNFLVSRGWKPSVVPDHLETKLAWDIRRAVQDYLRKSGDRLNATVNVVINNTEGVCRMDALGVPGCWQAVGAILPYGTTLRVWTFDPEKGIMIPNSIAGLGSWND